MAAGILIAALTSLGLWQLKLNYDKSRQYNPQEYTGHPGGICIKVPPVISYCPQEQGGPRAEEQRSDDDLKAQQEMAFWSFIVALTSVAGFVLSAVGVVLIYATFSATRDQVLVARAANALAAAEINPRIRIESPKVRVIVAAQPRIQASFKIENRGKSAARNVSYDVLIVIWGIQNALMYTSMGPELPPRFNEPREQRPDSTPLEPESEHNIEYNVPDFILTEEELDLAKNGRLAIQMTIIAEFDSVVGERILTEHNFSAIGVPVGKYGGMAPVTLSQHPSLRRFP